MAADDGHSESSRQSQGTQHFGHAPGLRDAATRRVRRLGIEDLADRTETGLAQMRLEAAERLPCALPVTREHFEPGIDERPSQPSPDGALVIGCIARAQVAKVV